MRITVRGAGGGEVTGSAYLVQTSEAKVLVDCGLFQGARKVENYNRIPMKGAFEKLSAVVLTHAHLDHTGRLPLLTRAGYSGPIYATPATIDFADLKPYFHGMTTRTGAPSWLGNTSPYKPKVSSVSGCIASSIRRPSE